jgi:hypothetical protein
VIGTKAASKTQPHSMKGETMKKKMPEKKKDAKKMPEKMMEKKGGSALKGSPAGMMEKAKEVAGGGTGKPEAKKKAPKKKK